MRDLGHKPLTPEERREIQSKMQAWTANCSPGTPKAKIAPKIMRLLADLREAEYDLGDARGDVDLANIITKNAEADRDALAELLASKDAFPPCVSTRENWTECPNFGDLVRNPNSRPHCENRPIAQCWLAFVAAKRAEAANG